VRQGGEGEDVMALILSHPGFSNHVHLARRGCCHHGESGHGSVAGLKSAHSEVEPRSLV
jgi:hypothetical protein